MAETSFFASTQYQAYPQLLELIASGFSKTKPRKTIDVGGGDGTVARRAAEYGGGRVWCVDPQTKNHGSEAVEFVRAKGEKLPFPDEFFDAALACFSLEYCGDARRALKETRRVAKNAALFCALFHHPDSFWAVEFEKQKRTYALALSFLKNAAEGKATPAALGAALNAFERRAAAINNLPFPPLANASLEALERFEAFSERPDFKGDWLPSLYAALASMQKSVLLGKTKTKKAVKTAEAEYRAVSETTENLPKHVFQPRQALKLLEKTGFAVERSLIVLDNRGKPLAFATEAKAR